MRSWDMHRLKPGNQIICLVPTLSLRILPKQILVVAKTTVNVGQFVSFNPFMPIEGTLENCVDTDQTPQNAASDQCQHCLHYIKIFL